MSKYTVTLSDEDIQMIKDCHSKNPSIMKALDEAKKIADQLKKCRTLQALHFYFFEAKFTMEFEYLSQLNLTSLSVLPVSKA